MNNTVTQVIGWHFAGTTLRDGRPLPHKGDTLVHDGLVVPCDSGYHASEQALDALKYAPGMYVARVRLHGTVVAHGEPTDKHAASHREMLSDYYNAKAVIVGLSRTWALRAIRVHGVRALRAAGLMEHADKLSALPDDCDLSAAAIAAIAASDAARAASYAASYAASDAIAAIAASVASDAARAASDAASYAASYASAEERDTCNAELTAALEQLTWGKTK